MFVVRNVCLPSFLKLRNQDYVMVVLTRYQTRNALATGASGLLHGYNSSPRFRAGVNTVSNQAQGYVRRAGRYAANRAANAYSSYVRGSQRRRSDFVAKGGRQSRYVRGRKRRLGRKRSSRKRGKKGAISNGRIMSMIRRKLTTPLTYKTTIAQTRSGLQGQRQWLGCELGGEQIVKNLALKRPANFLSNTAAGTSSTATLQDLGQAQYQMCIDKFLWDMRIQNRGNASMELKIYECVVRHDISATDFSTGVTGAQTFFNTSSDPPTFVGGGQSNLGPVQAAFPTGMTHNHQHPTYTPYMSNQFCSFFKILKCHSFCLGPNEIVPKKFYAKAKTFKGSHIEATASYEWQKGWSKYLLFSWVGMPVDDGTVNNQTKAKTDLFLQADITIKYHFLPGYEPLSNFAYTNLVNGFGDQYSFDPAGMVVVVPASDTIQTVVGPVDTTTDAAP